MGNPGENWLHRAVQASHGTGRCQPLVRDGAPEQVSREGRGGTGPGSEGRAGPSMRPGLLVLGGQDSREDRKEATVKGPGVTEEMPSQVGERSAREKRSEQEK